MTTSSIQQMILLVSVCLAHLTCRAQAPLQVTVTAVFGSPVPDDGLHRLVVRWYDDPFTTAPLWEESVVAEIIAGRSEIVLGRTVVLADTMLRGGRAFIGLTLESESERKPRQEIIPLTSALHAGYADVAARLDPRATGLVTSLNELSGPVSLRGSNGIRVQRDGTTLTISTAPLAPERGSIAGDGLATTYRVRPSTVLTPTARVTFRSVSPTTTLAVQLDIDTGSNELIFTVSAPLLPDERIEWSITP